MPCEHQQTDEDSASHYNLVISTIANHNSYNFPVVVSAQFLWFQISTFDKPQFPRSLILALRITLPSFPFVLLPPYDSHTKTNTDKKTRTDYRYSRVVHGQQQQTLVLQNDARNI